MVERRTNAQSRSIGIHLPRTNLRAPAAIALRLGAAVALVLFMTLLVYIDRDGYYDSRGGELSLLDAFYYTTVSITTTGYGDIVPAKPEARLLTTLVMTPARLLFLVILVGTTLAVLTERSRHAFRVDRWRRSLKDHVIVCGYGTKGRSAVQTLLAQGYDKSQLVIIDRNEQHVREATSKGMATISGDASRMSVLREAEADKASSIVVAVDRDDAAVLTTLTAREINPGARITAAVREQENVHLLRQGGADSVITSSDASGHLLGMATTSPQIVKVLEDLLTAGSGLEVAERAVRREEVGSECPHSPTEIVLAVVRDGKVIRFDEPAAREVRRGDRLITVQPFKN